MPAIFIIIYVIWGLSEALINRLLRSNAMDKANVDKRSLPLIWVGVFVGISLAIFISIRYYLPITPYGITNYIGLAILVIGVVLRLLIIKSLGSFFTVAVTIRQNHTLKTNGFYTFIRHPSYAASLLSFIGFGISLNNWASLIIVTILLSLVFINRIKVEEKALIEYFGQEYIDYKKTTKALFPFIY